MHTISDSWSLLFLLLATGIGALIGYFLARVRSKSNLDQTIAVVRGEELAARTAFEERIIAREASIADLKVENAELESNIEQLRQNNTELYSVVSELNEKLRGAAEEQALLEKIQKQFTDAFKALSSDALKSNNQAFIELAQASLGKFHEAAKGDLEKRHVAINELVQPVRESLIKFDSKIQEIEVARVGAYEGLSQQVKSLLETQIQLRTETGNLVKALGTPRVRGRWGEIQLRRVVELAGMLDHCDFTEQPSVSTEEGRLRPDLIVHLPSGKTIVVDAKAPLAGYLEALEAQDEETRVRKLIDHARHLKEHALALGKKAYWEQFTSTPEFVVLFVPGESFFSAALEQSPDLIEQGVAERVLFATPTTLIALLKAVAYGWRQESLAKNAAEISALGKELYKRLSDVTANFGSLGQNLSRAVESYNKAVHNLESRVLVSARRFKDLDSTGVEKEIEILDPVHDQPRLIQAEELTTSKLIS